MNDCSPVIDNGSYFFYFDSYINKNATRALNRIDFYNRMFLPSSQKKQIIRNRDWFNSALFEWMLHLCAFYLSRNVGKLILNTGAKISTELHWISIWPEDLTM